MPTGCREPAIAAGCARSLCVDSVPAIEGGSDTGYLPTLILAGATRCLVPRSNRRSPPTSWAVKMIELDCAHEFLIEALRERVEQVAHFIAALPRTALEAEEGGMQAGRAARSGTASP